LFVPCRAIQPAGKSISIHDIDLVELRRSALSNVPPTGSIRGGLQETHSKSDEQTITPLFPTVPFKKSPFRTTPNEPPFENVFVIDSWQRRL
jgi:hypothetical protein